jgi:DNA-binding MarR family transcriptional regulator
MVARGSERNEMLKTATRGTSPATTRDPGVLAWMRLARVYTAIDRRTAQFLRQFDLTTAQFDVIAQVGAREGRTQQELAQALLVTKGNVTQLLDRLEERGLIERRTTPGRRGKAIHLTETGRALNRQVVPAQEALIASLFEPLEPEDRVRLGGLLRRIDRTLGEPGEGV